jgi:ferritin-like metal-binding protein YciE
MLNIISYKIEHVLLEQEYNKNRFMETLNELFSLENAVLERLVGRMRETSGQEAQSSLLQQQLQEEKEQQSRLRKLICDYGGRPTDSKS